MVTKAQIVREKKRQIKEIQKLVEQQIKWLCEDDEYVLHEVIDIHSAFEDDELTEDQFDELDRHAYNVMKKTSSKLTAKLRKITKEHFKGLIRKVK